MWTASAGFYWSANPGEGILGDGTGNSTLAQLIWSADNVADYANAYNLHFVSGDDVWLADLIITENGIPGDEDDYAYFTAPIFDDGGAIGTGRYFRVREDDTILGTNAAGARLFSAAAIDLYGMTLDPAADASLESWIGDQLPQGSVAYLWDRESNGYIVHSRGRGGWTGGSLYRGDALWLRPESATDFLLVGFVPDVETTILHLSPGDFVAYPFPADLVWTNSQAAQQASWGDVIYVWNDKYDGYSKGRGGWSTPEGFVISNASAFWFKTSTVTNWTEPVPYDWQLD